MNSSTLFTANQDTLYSSPAAISACKNCNGNHAPDKGSWIGFQHWEHLIFLHWAVDPQLLSGTVPNHPDIQMDTYNGMAWLSLVGFSVSNCRLRYIPPIPGLSSFAELNLRTYIQYKGSPGVVFLNIDTNNGLAAFTFRLAGLPYHKQICKSSANRFYHINCDPAQKSLVHARWHPSLNSLQDTATAGWLTERYYSCQQRGANVHCYPICHSPWHLQTVDVSGDISYRWHNGVLRGENLVAAHYADAKDVLFYPSHKI